MKLLQTIAVLLTLAISAQGLYYFIIFMNNSFIWPVLLKKMQIAVNIAQLVQVKKIEVAEIFTFQYLKKLIF